MLPLKTWRNALGLALLVLCAAAPAGAAPTPTPDKTGLAVDPLTPADTEVLVVIDARRFLDAPLVKKNGLEEGKAALKKNEEVGKILTAAGIDPFKDIDTLTFAASGAGKEAKGLAVIRGRFDPNKVHDAAEDYAKKNEDKLTITKEGSVQVYEVKGKDKPAYAAFADRNTLIVAPTKEATLDAVKEAGKAAGKLNADLQQALTKLSGKESVWLAVVITGEMRKGMEKNPQMKDLAGKLESVTGGVTLTDEALIQLQIHTKDEKAALQLKKTINQVKPLLAVVAQSNEEAGPLLSEFLDNLKITSAKTGVSVSLKITQEMIDKAAKMKDKDK